MADGFSLVVGNGYLVPIAVAACFSAVNSSLLCREGLAMHLT